MDYFSVFNEEEFTCQHSTQSTVTNNQSITFEENKLESVSCIHENTVMVNSDLTCTDCGVIVEKIQTYEKEWRHYSNESKSNPARCMARKTQGVIILKDLENMGIPRNVINIANELYIQVTKGKIKRGKKSRKAIIVACLFHAYKKIGQPKSCDALREILKDIGLDKSDFLHGIKQIALNIEKSEDIHSTYITPKDIVIEIMNLLNSNESQKEDVITLYESLISKSRLFKESKPQSVAAGVVFHYILTSGISMSIKEFAVKVKISELTINKIRNEIKRVLLDVKVSNEVVHVVE